MGNNAGSDSGVSNDQAPCATCGSIPDDLLVNTGRDERFPAAVSALTWMHLDGSEDLRACPRCGALFVWLDLPQHYGSGNNAEERLTRLNAGQATIARTLLKPTALQPDGRGLLLHAFRNLPHALVFTLLGRLAAGPGEEFEPFLNPLIEALCKEGGLALYQTVNAYWHGSPARMKQVMDMIDAAGADIGKSAQYMREQIAQRLQSA